MPVAHTYNPSYSGGRDQEDRGSRVSLANSQKNPILKILNITQYQKRKKERKKNNTQHKKRACRVAEVVEHLPSKRGALSSSLIPPPKIYMMFKAAYSL
jgi:hypothetical protein